jgi:hypothetical protein
VEFRITITRKREGINVIMYNYVLSFPKLSEALLYATTWLYKLRGDKAEVEEMGEEEEKGKGV